ncbi:MAG: molybdopterin-dependent oxidoreductase [Prolixibacteraceae bacterium]
MISNDHYKSTCSYCGVGCGVVVSKKPDGKVMVRGDDDHPVNRGKLCSKGLNLHYVVNNKTDRLLYPQVRLAKGYPLRKAEWPEAVNRVATVFKTLIDKFGPDAVALYVSGQCLTEEYYVATKLAKGFWGTNNIDTNSRLCMSSAVAGYKMQLGEDAVPVSYDDIELADCFYIAGANPAWCHPILFRRIEAHKAANPDVKIIVADPRKTQSCALADLHLQLTPGTDVFLNHAIGRCLIEEGYADRQFVKNSTEGYQAYRQKVMELSLDESASICGLSKEEIVTAARYIGQAKGYISMWAMGLNQSVIGVNKNLSLINLSLITGKIGKPGSGPFSLTGQPNAMGGREVGGMYNLLPAHRDLNNDLHRKEVAGFWGVDSIPARPGLSATEMIDALESDKLKAVWIICTNPMVSLPNSNKVEKALRKARFVVVQDISDKSDTLPFADVVFPAAGWLEKDGTMTNSDRRISYLRKITDAPGEALPDFEIICRVARKMGYHGFGFKSSREVFDEYKQLTNGTNLSIEELSYQFLTENGTVQWPFKNGRGTKRLFEDGKFYTTSGKARIFAVEGLNESEPPSANFPLILTTGRIRDQWHTMTRTGKVRKLGQHISGSCLEIHPEDALKYGLENDDIAVIKGKKGHVQVPVKLTGDMKPGVVFLPMHWGRLLSGTGARTNNLTNDLIDPKSKEPDFKYTAVSVAKYIKPKERVLIVGAGAAALRFIRTFREKNRTDEILVISKEIYPFYNRVLLPGYIGRICSWEDLRKTGGDEIEKLGIRVITGVSVVKIDPDNKTVSCSDSQVYTYGKLILATGARPGIPNQEWMRFPAVFTIRSKQDADLLRQSVQSSDHVLVTGGGLLGLEVAAALIDLNIRVTLANRNPRLMDRQLDHESAEMLKDILEERGINILYNDEISQISRSGGQKHQVTFKSGKRITFDALVFAIGTRPNLEYARNAVQIRRGIVVNEHLQTSREDIYAIGEIAELNGKLFGITAAAEEQADTLANHLNGNPLSQYDGSVPMNMLKISGIDLCSIGLVHIPGGSQGYDEVVFTDRAARYYKKCIVKDDILVGAILMGDKAEFAEFRKLIAQKTELGTLRGKLLRSGKAAEPVIGKLLCSCNNVGEGNILKAIRSGTHHLDLICEQTGAGTGCGSCRTEVQKMLKAETESLMIN